MERSRECLSRNPTSKKRITTASAKAKGRALQQWVCAKLSEALDLQWGKDELIASREMGQSGTDIRLIGEAQTRFPFSIECKACEAWSVPQWIAQAKANQKEGTEWLLVIKKRRERPVVVMDAERFIALFVESAADLSRTRDLSQPESGLPVNGGPSE